MRAYLSLRFRITAIATGRAVTSALQLENSNAHHPLAFRLPHSAA